jgi:maltooligosyltrehalose trehalohydrolase
MTDDHRIHPPLQSTPARPRNENNSGATVLKGGGTHFRVWAPKARTVDVERYTPSGAVHHRLEAQDDGFHAGVVQEAGPGTRYRFRLDGGQAYPDPASRYQPEGVHGPSEVVDPTAYRWSDSSWDGLDGNDSSLTIYELHVGTFSPEGTFEGVIPQLEELAELGV